jgi:hypothetical protein
MDIMSPLLLSGMRFTDRSVHEEIDDDQQYRGDAEYPGHNVFDHAALLVESSDIETNGMRREPLYADVPDWLIGTAPILLSAHADK